MTIRGHHPHSDWPAREAFYSIRPYGFAAQYARDFLKSNDNTNLARAFTWALSKEGWAFWHDVYWTTRGAEIPNYPQARSAIEWYLADHAIWTFDKIRNAARRFYGDPG